MEIESYSFGQIVIDGKSYSSDVIISRDGVQSDWYRDSGHLLQREDLEDVLAYSPEVVVIGTGYSGMMEVDAEVREILKDRKIELHIATTEKAAELLNDLFNNDRKAVGAFHLTC